MIPPGRIWLAIKRGGAMRSVFSIGLAALVAASLATVALAQEGPGGAINPGRDCQTIRKCDFSRSGLFRGCISTYSCRVCRFVQARCDSDGSRRSCRRLSCTWG